MTATRLLALIAAGLLAGAASPPSELAAAAKMRADVTFLASDRLQGRETGSIGYALAADYVRGRFAEIGLTPAGSDAGWYIPVPLRHADVDGTPRVTLTTGGASRALDTQSEIGIRPSVTERRRTIDAALVFVGHGLSEPKLGIDEYAGLDVRGKIVVALPGVPAGLPRDVSSHVQARKEQTAAAKGAVGFAQLSFGDYNPAAGYSQRGIVDWADSTGATGDLGAVRVRLALSPSLSQALFLGAPQSLITVGASGAVTVHGFDLPGRLHIEAQSAWTDYRSPEVLGVLRGSDAGLAREYVVMTAHLDHLGVKRDARPGEDAIYNGALDNAAGVATLLEIARRLTVSGKPPRRSVLFVANTGEELGLLGADYLAAHPPVPLGAIVGVIDIDMPLLTYDFTDVAAFGADHSSIGTALQQATANMRVSRSSDPMPQEGLFVRSDHYPFVVRGVPSLFLMTGFANGGRAAWARYMAQAYHQPGDDLSQPIHWRAGARFAELNYRIARLLADADDRPQWTAGDYFGETFGGKRR